jgi:hypothetical protein
VSKRNPNISIHCHPISLIEEPERIRATRRGEVVHYALGWLGRAPGTVGSAAGAAGADGEAARLTEPLVEQAVVKALAILDLDPGEWKIQDDFVRPLLRVFTLPEFKAWFDPAATSLVEAEIMDAGGDVYRPDRIVVRGDRIEVIDFKVGKREEAHKEQVGTYADLLRAVFEGMQVAGYLVYIDEPAIVEVR